MRSISLAVLIAGLLCAPAAADAAVAFDVLTVCSNQTTDPITCAHTPTGTPRAVLIYIFQNEAVDQVVSCDYGGDAMTEVTGSPNEKVAAEAMILHSFFLGTSIPTGAQTVTCDVSNTIAKRIVVITLTAAADTEIVDQDVTINSDSVANPSVTLSLSSRTSFAAIGFGAGGVDTSTITPLTNWTGAAPAGTEVDNGASQFGVYTYDVIGSTDVTAGWTQAADDAIAIAVAISESGAAATKKCPGLLLGFQGCL
jgi:hypothetical protein